MISGRQPDSPEGISPEALYGYSHYLYGEAYFGSHRGMRFRLARDPLAKVALASREKQEEGAHFLLTLWPGPWSFDRTPEEKRTEFRFPFTEEGLREAVECLNAEYIRRKPEWDAVLRTPLI